MITKFMKSVTHVLNVARTLLSSSLWKMVPGKLTASAESGSAQRRMRFDCAICGSNTSQRWHGTTNITLPETLKVPGSSWVCDDCYYANIPAQPQSFGHNRFWSKMELKLPKNHYIGPKVKGSEIRGVYERLGRRK